MMTAAQKLRQIVNDAKGDDLERATAAFRNCSPAEMNQEYVQSGKLRRTILEDYQQERTEWARAKDLLDQLLAGRK